MPKRKRVQAESNGVSSPSQSDKRIQQKLFHASKLLHRALKTAKAFERQKLARRSKIAAQDVSQSDIRRIDAEIESLKVYVALCSF